VAFDWKKAFEVVNQALSAIASAGDIPGVNLIPYVSVISSAAKAIQAGVNAGVKVAPYVEAIRETFAGGLPTPEKIAALDAKIKELEGIVYADLPEPDEGEPE
jgi:hypothetical protein